MKTSYLSLVLCIVGFSASGTSSVNQDMSDLCSFPSVPPRSQVPLGFTPSWFFKPFPDSDKIAFSTGGSNYLLADNRVIELPGKYDAIPVDEHIVVTPGYRFFSTQEILSMPKNDANDATVLLKDYSASGLYQSTGALDSDGSTKTIRMFNGYGGGLIRDYKISGYGAGADQNSLAVNPIGEARYVCQNVSFKLPMLSKDGKEVAGVDSISHTTKIYRIDPETGNCFPVADLGVAVGKVDFSYDGKSVAFHMKGERERGGWFRSPSTSDGIDVFTWNRETKQFRQITNNNGENSYFPGFRRDGSLVYIHQNKNSKFSFVTVDPASTTPYGNDLANCDDDRKTLLFAIGRLRLEVCNMDKYSKQEKAHLAALSLSQQQCEKLVRNYWEAKKKEITKKIRKQQTFMIRLLSEAGDSSDALSNIDLQKIWALKPETIIAACPARSDVSPSANAPASEQSGPPDGKALVNRRCSICHTDVNFENLSELKASGFLDKAISMVASGNMPKDAPFEMPTQKDAVLNYLRGKLSP